MIQLRNPWGQDQIWDGPYGPKDVNHWNKISVSERKRFGMMKNKDDDDDDSGTINKDDGTWWMSFHDFWGQFDEISLCQKFVGYQQHHIVGEWINDNAGGFKNPQLCPQYQLDVSEDCHLIVELRQRHPAAVGGQGRIGGGDCEDDEWMYIAPLVCYGGIKGQRMIEFSDTRIECINGGDHGAAIKSNVVQCYIKANQGPFIIVPLGKENISSTYYLDIHTSSPSTITPLNDFDLPTDYETGELLKGQVTAMEGQDGKINYVLSKNKKSTTIYCHYCKRSIERSHQYLSVTENVKNEKVTFSVHEKCFEAYKSSKISKCIQCRKPIQGKFYDLGKKGKIHIECEDAYDASKGRGVRESVESIGSSGGGARGGSGGGRGGGGSSSSSSSASVINKKGKVTPPPVVKSDKKTCSHCKKVFKPGSVIYSLKEKDNSISYLHEKCIELSKKSKASSCIHCHEPILDACFNLPKYGKVHDKCLNPFQLSVAPKCVQCGQPVSDIGGKFTGKAFKKDNGVIHEECYNIGAGVSPPSPPPTSKLKTKPKPKSKK